MNIELTQEEAKKECSRIVAFLRQEIPGSVRAVIPLSGGIDSDVVARLTVGALGKGRTKFFTVIQADMDPGHLENARQVADDLGVHLAELHFESMPATIIGQLAVDDQEERFSPKGLLDTSRAKCSFRTVLLSTYQDRGYLVIGTGNRTEWLTGFFLPFGDALCHFAPLIHLFKSQVRALARELGTHQRVLDQPASAGFWLGQSDLEDLAWWIVCGQPVPPHHVFTDEDEAMVLQIRKELSTLSVDLSLQALEDGLDDNSASRVSGLSLDCVRGLQALCRAARKTKHLPLKKGLNQFQDDEHDARFR